MGIRFRKSIKVAPGVRVNVGKKSSSVSFGGKGFSTSVSPSGRNTRTVGIPGTGISHVSTSGGKRSNVTHHTTTHQKPASSLLLKVCGVIMWIIGILALLLAIVGFTTDGAVGILFLIIGIPCIFFAWLWCGASKESHKSQSK
jgi:hypothetical protein